MKRRLLATFLSLCLLVGLLPTVALAADEETGAELSAVCTCEALCTEEAVDETCPVCAENYTLCAYVAPDDEKEPVSCTATEGCTLEDGHEGACVTQLGEPACAQLEGCVDGVHATDCPLYVEPTHDTLQGQEEPAAQPVTSTESTPNLLNGNEASGPLSGTCGAEGSEADLTWTLTQNNSGSEPATYTLTISGSGAMADYNTTETPWYQYRTGITKVELPNGLTRIGKSAFLQTAITNVTIPDTVTSIGKNAFWGCDNIETTIPASVMELGETAFFGNFKVSIDEKNPNYMADKNSVIYSRDLTKLIQAPKKYSGTLTIPDSVTEIGPYAFYSCTDLTGLLQIPNQVIVIGTQAFYGTGITGLALGNSVAQIGNLAFGDCQSLTGELIIPDSVVSIEEGAFRYDNAITSINFGKNIKTISKNTFNGCSKVGSINLNEGLEIIDNSAFASCTALTGTLTIPDTVKTIGDSAFSNTAITELLLSSSLETIGHSAFYRCKELEAVHIPASVKSIGKTAFSDSDKIKIVTVPYGTLQYGGGDGEGYAFAGISNSTLETVVLGCAPNGVDANELFNNSWSALKTLVLGAGVGSIGGEATFSATDDYAGLYPSTMTIKTTNQNFKNKSVEYTLTSETDIRYGCTLKMMTFSGTNRILNGISYSSSNAEILSVDGEGEITAIGDAGSTATITALYSDTPFAEIEITVAAKSVNVTMSDSTVDYDGNTKAIQATAGENETLPADLTLVYSYKESSADDSTYTSIPPTAPGTYTVKVESGNPNYTLTGTTTATLTISTPSKTDVSKDAVVVAPASLVYDGSAKSYTATYEGISEWSIVYYDSDGAKLDSAPVDAGDYTVTINGVGESNYASITKEFTIIPAPLTITADNQTIYVGGTLPEYTYTVSGLADGDTLTTPPTVTCSNADANTAGTYTITAIGADAGKNYTITYANGTLTVSRRSSGGGSSSGSTGNVTGSGDDVNIDVSGGSVPTAQMEKAVDKADRGETITIEASSRSSVSLPSSGLQGAADNNNDVTVELKNGEVTLSPEALSAVAEQAGTTVTLTVDPVDTDELNSRQQAAVGDAPVFDLTLKSGGKTITDFDGGLVTVAIPYELPDDQDPAGVVVWFMDDNGNITACETMYDLRTETVIFTTRHFSKYVIGYEEPMDFTDVSEDAYYADAVLWAVANGVTNGTSATTFSPDMAVSRAQMVTFLWRAHGSPKATGTNPFTDVSTSDYYYDAVLWAVANGVTNGTSATTFSPDAPVTRAQAVTFQWRAAGSPVVSGSSFGDVTADAYYVNAVTWAVANGITNGTSATTFSPDVVVSRAQAVTFLWRELA